jgi:hypothetical protein
MMEDWGFVRIIKLCPCKESFEKNSALWSAPNTAVVPTRLLTAIVQETVQRATIQRSTGAG